MSIRYDRVRVMRDALNAVTEEYQRATNEAEVARTLADTARVQFTGIKQLARQMLSDREWRAWEDEHADMVLVGLPIGDAIISVLRMRAFEAADAHLQSNKQTPFAPVMHVDELVDALKAGGFEFQGVPKREVYAALLHLKGVTKAERGSYQWTSAHEVLDLPLGAERPPKLVDDMTR